MGAQATIRVGDGTAPGAAYTATIESQIIGTSELVKTDLGTLILAGNNSYSGGTAVNTGTLLVHGDQSAATGVTSVGAAPLGGTGTRGGAVILLGGTLAPGRNGGGTPTIDRGLVRDAPSPLSREYVRAGVVGGVSPADVN